MNLLEVTRGELISRRAAIECIIDTIYDIDEADYVAEELKKVPPVQIEQKTGRWIDAREQCGEFMCSNCQFFCCTNQYNYCPNCGAKMEDIK